MVYGRIQAKVIHQTLQVDGREVELAGWVYRIVLAPGFTSDHGHTVPRSEICSTQPGGDDTTSEPSGGTGPASGAAQ